MNEFMELTASYGFPMVMATYLLVRIDKRLAALEAGIRELCTVLKSKNL